MEDYRVVTHTARYEMEWHGIHQESGIYDWAVDYDERDGPLEGEELCRNLALTIILDVAKRLIGLDCVDDSIIDRSMTKISKSTYVVGNIRITLTDITTA